MGARFKNPITVQGTESGDSRLFLEFEFRELPLPFRWVRNDEFGHNGAQSVGVLESVSLEGNLWWGEGEYADIPAAVEAEALAKLGAQFISVDPGGRIEYHWEILDAAGTVVDPVDVERAYDDIHYGSDDADKLKDWLSGLRERTVFDFYEAGGITQVDIPCFPEARIALVGEAAPGSDVPVAADELALAKGLDRTPEVVTRARKMLARMTAAGPTKYPDEAFAKQELDCYTPFTVTDDGWFQGHIAPWNACHRGFTSRCVKPAYQTEFPDFHTGGEVALESGSRLKIGVITHWEGHLDSVAAYTKVMEDPACQLGPARLYADQWGIQASGHVWNDVTPDEIARAVAGRPSGDWRLRGGDHVLFGCAIVNTAGYVGSVEEDGEVVRLVASVPPPAPGQELPAMDQVFFDAPPSVIRASCPCEAPAAPAAHDDDHDHDHADGEDCGCGGSCGGCGTAKTSTPLDAQALADLAHLDEAVTVRRRLAGITG